MKNLFPNSLGGLLLILALTVFQTGCLSDGSEQEQPLDPSMDLDETMGVPDAFPLENMRMDGATAKMLGKLRSATAKYHRLEVALEDGYILGSECVASADGGMGFHYILPPAIDGALDYDQPEALLYEMDKHGKLKLVGIEYVIVAALWDLENDDTPHFGVQVFDEVPAPVPLPFDNYQLHVWVWKNNPAGIFMKYNPNVKCL
ncbi:hypothetical protein J0A68_17470 [Algoriphagus sp. H41]|uniref:Uncharacterized protein n=1 Tax=Algoriphagus oliviformis TaxID=2811231 RepID=A0ABS3C6W3_9BACT|nr:hypothetical protein [Algoriphagus oliviformis]MBN7812748.1 hypothetical protein [Algoriphagus oliviformis]